MNPTGQPTPTAQGMPAYQPNQGTTPPAELTSYLNDPRLQQAQGQYQQAQGAASQSQQVDTTLPSMLRQILAEKFSQSNPLIQQRQSALESYLNSVPASQAAVLPENQGGTILSPIHQADLIQKMQSAKLAPLTTANYLLGLQTGGLQNVIEAAGAAHQASTQGLQAKAELAHQNYGDLLTNLSKQAEIALQERGQSLTAQRFSFDLSGGLKGIKSQQLVADAQKGITLKDALNKYKGQLTPDEVFSTYNASSKYGAAKETSQQLLKLGIKPPFTNDELTRIDALKPAQAAIDKLSNEMINLSGPQNKGWNQFSIKNVGGFGVDQRVVSANGAFALLKQNVVRALQGSRMSDQDIKMAQSYIPEITDIPATVRTKLANLQTFINSVNPQSKQTTLNSSNTGGTWEVVKP